ncbi:hypothetical protein CkaCkLH20_03576 [Colletotrichum karsti]|uniref:Nad dependent epimerase dehydratase family protein n=1 Tax=Colletotrichum karsti TaxID=1095194 RepID=A0A9P6IDR2_9PEZI|nr:uncharacterized protein CkaCkLH20_03576 [Colletotrichum karsti]KAF9878676.1 hypothetical protein CkaCkLH20_03576 [Colletotrichum karsti]
MSKQDHDDAPPSYTDSISSPSPSLSSSHHPQTLTTTLTTLTTLLRTTQSQQSALESATTSTLLPLLTPHLTTLLTRLGTHPYPPSLAELVLVPAAAVGPSWTVASDADPKAGEVVQVVRVVDPDTKGGGEKGDDAFGTGESSTSRASRGFDDWGRWDDEPSPGKDRGGRLWWWDDEGLARRLARELQPEPKMDRTVVRAAVEQAKEEKKASRWGLFRGSSAEASSSSSSAPPPRSEKSTPGRDEDVSMSVRAEEVTFRRENEMGIWEGTRGWGIVARVRIRR